MALSIEGWQQVSVVRRSQHLLPKPQRQDLASFAEGRELEALEGALVSASLLLPASILPAQDDVQAFALDPFEFLVLVFC